MSVFGDKFTNRVDILNFHECYPLQNAFIFYVTFVCKFGPWAAPQSSKLTTGAPKASNDDWGNDWSDVLSNPKDDKKSAEKKSKPLKLGQKKSMFD